MGDTHSLVSSRTASSTSESNDVASTRKTSACQLPTPVSHQPANSYCTFHSYPSSAPSRPLCYIISMGRASTPKKSGARRMNTLPSPSLTELTCAPCLTLRTSGWLRSAKHMSAREAFVQHPTKLSFMLLRLYCKRAQLQPDGVKPSRVSLEIRALQVISLVLGSAFACHHQGHVAKWRNPIHWRAMTVRRRESCPFHQP